MAGEMEKRKGIVLITIHYIGRGGIGLRVRGMIDSYMRLGYSIVLLLVYFSTRFSLSISREKGGKLVVMRISVPFIPLIALDLLKNITPLEGLIERLEYTLSRFAFLLPLALLDIATLFRIRHVRALITKIIEVADIVQLESILAPFLIIRLLPPLTQLGMYKKTILHDAHNVEIAVFSRNRLTRVFLLGFLFRAERLTVTSADKVLVPTILDKKLLSSYYSIDGARIHVVPNILPDEYIETCNSLKTRLKGYKAGKYITASFLGRITYPPNNDAYEWIVSYLVSRLDTAAKKIGLPLKIYLAGEGMPLMYKNTGSVAIYSLGSVPPRLDIVITIHSDLVLVPLRYGGGSKYKTILALVCGRPLISTLEGVRGLEENLELIKEISILVPNEDRDLIAERIIELLNNPEKLYMLKEAASSLSTYFMERYSSIEASRLLAEVLREVHR